MERNKYIFFLYAFKSVIYRLENDCLVDVTSNVLKANGINSISQCVTYDHNFDCESVFSPSNNRLTRVQSFHYYFEKYNILTPLIEEEACTRKVASIIMNYQVFLDKYDPTKKEIIALVSQNSLKCLIHAKILNKQFKWNYPFNEELLSLLNQKGYKRILCINEFSLIDANDEDHDLVQLKEIYKYVETMLLKKYPVLGGFRESAIQKLTDAFSLEALIDNHKNSTMFQDYLFELTNEEYEKIKEFVKEKLEIKIKAVLNDNIKKAIVVLANEKWIKDFIESKLIEYKKENIDIYDVEDILPYMFEYQLLNYKVKKMSQSNNIFVNFESLEYLLSLDTLKNYKYLNNAQKIEITKELKTLLNKMNNIKCK